jgi:rhodanese-related sulfurtransferase
VREYTAREAFEAWQAGSVAIIDVREEREHVVNRIEGVPLVPMSEIEDRVDELPVELPLVIMCRSGARSARVAEYLNELGGRPEAANLEGGIIAWAVEGLPYEGETPG